MRVLNSCNKVRGILTLTQKTIKTFCFILAILVLIIFAVVFHNHSLEIIDYIDDLGWLAPVLFLITYC
ncbi:TPA: TVP38/TMEM64 family protein, partial [Legionella pneumophila]